MKNPFKLQSAISTGVAMLTAGAGSAAVDWALEKSQIIPAEWGNTAVNGLKVLAGAIVGSMVKSKGTLSSIVKSVADGVATVGAANLTSSFIGGTSAADPAPTAGLAPGTIGRTLHLGNKAYRRGVRGVNGAASFMGK